MVQFVKQSGEPQYSDEVIAKIEESVQEKEKAPKGGAADLTAADEGDELFPAAVEVVLETGQASVSMLQRRLKLGYSRAARLVDQMEDRGVVGPFEGSKPPTAADYPRPVAGDADGRSGVRRSRHFRGGMRPAILLLIKREGTRQGSSPFAYVFFPSVYPPAIAGCGGSILEEVAQQFGQLPGRVQVDLVSCLLNDTEFRMWKPPLQLQEALRFGVSRSPQTTRTGHWRRGREASRFKSSMGLSDGERQTCQIRLSETCVQA